MPENNWSSPPLYLARPGAPRAYQDPYSNYQAGRGKSEMITPQMLAQRRARSLRTPQQEEAAGVLADKIEQIMSDPNPAREPLTPMQASRLQLAQKNAAVFNSMGQPSAMQDSLNKQYASAMKIGLPAQPAVAGGPPSIFPQQGPNTRYVGRVDLPAQDKSGVNGLGFTPSGQAYIPRDGGGIESSRFVEGTERDGMKVTRNPETGGIMLQGGGRPLTPQQMQYLAQKRAAMVQAYKDTRAMRALDRNPQLADAAPVIGALGRLPVRKQDGTLASTGSPATAVPQPGPKSVANTVDGTGVGHGTFRKAVEELVPGGQAIANSLQDLGDNPNFVMARELLPAIGTSGLIAGGMAAATPTGRRLIGSAASGIRDVMTRPLFGSKATVPQSVPTSPALSQPVVASPASAQPASPVVAGQTINPLTGQPISRGSTPQFPVSPVPTQTPATPAAQPAVQPTQPAVATPSLQASTPVVAQPATTQQAAVPAKKGRGKAASKTGNTVPPSSAVMNQPDAVKAGIGSVAQPAPVAPTPSPAAVATAAPATAVAPAQATPPAATAQPSTAQAAKPAVVVPPTSTEDAQKILEVMMKNPGMNMDDARQVALGKPAAPAPSAKAVASTKAAKAMTAAKPATAPAAAAAPAPQPVAQAGQSQPRAWRLVEDAVADFKAANGGRNPTMMEMDRIENDVARYNATVGGIETPPPESAATKPKASSKSKKVAVGAIADSPVPVAGLPEDGMQVKVSKAQSNTATVESQLNNLSKFKTPQQQVEAVMANNPQSAKQFALQYKKMFGVDKPIGVEFPGVIDTPVQAKVAAPKTSKRKGSVAVPQMLTQEQLNTAKQRFADIVPERFRGLIGNPTVRMGAGLLGQVGADMGLQYLENRFPMPQNSILNRVVDSVGGYVGRPSELAASIGIQPALRIASPSTPASLESRVAGEADAYRPGVAEANRQFAPQRVMRGSDSDIATQFLRRVGRYPSAIEFARFKATGATPSGGF